ncbi:MAG: MCE family protein [Candidatus Firestonebacteria bacterium]|nr:MCE family protein [Candidatus Firestonebacteria bacterium]
MKSSRNYPAMQFKVGTLIAVAIAVTLLALIFPTKGVNFFSPKIKLTAFFPKVGGLRPSSPVLFSGVEVGSVSSVEFVPGSNPARLQVVLTVERKIQQYLRRDSRAVIQSMGLLGDMYIEVTSGSPGETMVENNAVITGVPPEDTKGELAAIMAEAKGLLANLNRVSEDIASGKGSLGLLVKDPALYRELQSAVTQIRTMLAAVNEGEGTAGKLLNDPELYDEMVASVKEIHAVVNDLKEAERTIISQQTKDAITETVKTASRVFKRVGEIEEKVDQIRFDFNFGMEKFLNAPVASGHADLLIWPNRQRYYQVGVQKVSSLYGNETENTTYTGQLAWRIFQTPLYIRGGVIKTNYFVGGLDLRLLNDDFKVMLDTYRVELNPAQVDVRTGVMLVDFMELTAGVEDVFRRPFYKAGLTIHYQDDDLLNVIFKAKF